MFDTYNNPHMSLKAINEDFFDDENISVGNSGPDFDDMHGESGVRVDCVHTFSKTKHFHKDEDTQESFTFGKDETVRVLRYYVHFIRNCRSFAYTEITGIRIEWTYNDEFPQVMEDISSFPDEVFGIRINKSEKATEQFAQFISVSAEIRFSCNMDFLSPRDFVSTMDAMAAKRLNGYRPGLDIIPANEPEHSYKMTFYSPDNKRMNSGVWKPGAKLKINTIANTDIFRGTDLKSLCYLLFDEERTEKLKEYVRRKDLTSYMNLLMHDLTWHMI